eukprot:UN23599
MAGEDAFMFFNVLYRSLMTNLSQPTFFVFKCLMKVIYMNWMKMCLFSEMLQLLA